MPQPWEKPQQSHGNPWDKPSAEEAPPPVPKAPMPAGMTTSSPNYAGMALRAGEAVKDIGKGLGESAVSLMSTGNHAVRKIPGIGEFLTTPITGTPADEAIAHTDQMATPANTTQAISKGVGDAAQFFIPGGAEEKLATMAPRAFRPAARIAAAALGSGTVNKAQGGGFGTGALMGAGGQVVGQGLKAMAPAIAEGALNIRKLDRAYGKGGGSIGRAILDETRGIRPGTVAASAEERLGELNPQLNAAADRASMRPNPTRGLLMAPPEEIPLQSSPNVTGRLSKPVILQSNRPMPREFPGYGINPSNPHIDLGDIPGEAGPIPPEGYDKIPEKFNGMGPHEYVGEIPGTRGGAGQSQGVLIRPPQVGNGPIPSMLSNPSASLGPARSVLSNAFGTAARQGERTTAGQLQPMATHLGETMSGDPIPGNVTPRQLLDLKRGFGNEFIHRWNPETMTGVKGTAARTYHTMADEFNRTVPEAEGLNSRISNLIPVAKRASSEELNAPTVQRAFNRFAAHTGALTGAGIGGTVGYKEGGVPGAVAGGLTGVFAPELIASPEGQMATARLLNKASALRPLVGTAAQFTRKRNDE